MLMFVFKKTLNSAVMSQCRIVQKDEHNREGKIEGKRERKREQGKGRKREREKEKR